MACSPHYLTSLDYFLWGTLKDRVYRMVPAMPEDAQERAVAACRGITPETLQAACRALHKVEVVNGEGGSAGVKEERRRGKVDSRGSTLTTSFLPVFVFRFSWVNAAYLALSTAHYSPVSTLQRSESTHHSKESHFDSRGRPRLTLREPRARPGWERVPERLAARPGEPRLGAAGLPTHTCAPAKLPYYTHARYHLPSCSPTNFEYRNTRSKAPIGLKGSVDGPATKCDGERNREHLDTLRLPNSSVLEGNNIIIKSLRSTVDNTVTVQSYLMIVTSGGWVELAVLTEQEHLLKSQPHSMQVVSDKLVAWADELRHRLFRADGRVRVWCKPNEVVDPSCKKGAVQTGGGSVMVWGVFTQHGLDPLVHVPTKLNENRYKTLLGDHLQQFIDFSFPDNTGMFQQDNACLIGLWMSRTGSKSILESSSECRGQHIPPTLSQSRIYGTWREPFAPKIMYLEIPGNFGQLFRQHSLTSLQRSSIHLWSPCDIELRHSFGLEGPYTLLYGYPMTFVMLKKAIISGWKYFGRKLIGHVVSRAEPPYCLTALHPPNRRGRGIMSSQRKKVKINATSGQTQSPSLARPHILAPSTAEVLRSSSSETKRGSIHTPSAFPGHNRSRLLLTAQPVVESGDLSRPPPAYGVNYYQHESNPMIGHQREPHEWNGKRTFPPQVVEETSLGIALHPMKGWSHSTPWEPHPKWWGIAMTRSGHHHGGRAQESSQGTSPVSQFTGIAELALN
ncbi:hypothetical protein PR048_021347 [Dryococelus australis]|uniref:Uncharacterized protein n=1 Tax=Dryococelus australis TaxID=614101 RepID=A0ABQ9GXY4_9NEOP|nr:hypothetical protein PR048_021347 [Dryococelus australis]